MRRAKTAHAYEHAQLAAAVDHLRELMPSLHAEVAWLDTVGPDRGADAELTLRVPRRRSPARFQVELKRTHLTYALVDGVIGQRASTRRPWILCAPYVAPPMARYLVDHGVGFLDETGNCHIAIEGEVLLHHVESRRIDVTGPAPQAVRAPGYNVIFTILAKPEILALPVRRIEHYANATKSTVSNQLRRLEADGILATAGGKLRLVRPRDLLDRFVAGYANVLRPRLYVGRYATPIRDADALEERIEHELPSTDASGERSWWWGGASACWRLTRHYRAPVTTLHIAGPPADTLRRLRALPSPTGALELLRIPAPAAVGDAEPRADAVHPLLIYAEMMASPDERVREAAAGLRERYLGASS